MRVPEWGWRNVAHEGHGFAGLVIFAACLLVYAALNLAVLVAAALGIAATGRAFARGLRAGSGKQPPISGE